MTTVLRFFGSWCMRSAFASFAPARVDVRGRSATRENAHGHFHSRNLGAAFGAIASNWQRKLGRARQPPAEIRGRVRVWVRRPLGYTEGRVVLNPDTQLLPKALVETVRSAPAGVFRRAFDGVLLLVVRVHSLDSPLTQGLQATNGGVVRTGFGLATEELPRIDLTEP